MVGFVGKLLWQREWRSIGGSWTAAIREYLIFFPFFVGHS